MRTFISRRHRAVLRTAVVAMAAAACVDRLLVDQVDESRLLASELEAPGSASLLVSSAIGDFECALGHYVVAQGLMGDELIDSQSSDAVDLDRRTPNVVSGSYGTANCTQTQLPGAYTPLSVARFTADAALTKLEGWTDAQVANRTDLIAQAAAHAGYSLLLLGEGMCSAAIDLGPEMTRAQLQAAAEERFTRAIAAATTSSNAAIRNMALVGRARARINQGKLAEARADAVLVPDGFVRNATYSGAATRRENRVWTMTSRNFFATSDPSVRDVRYGDVADPRIAIVDARTLGTDGFTPIFRPTKYASVSAPIPIARSAEARLIVAEVDGGSAAVAIIDDLHRRANIPLFSTTMPNATAAQIHAQVIEERRRELFLEGHRLNDLNRFSIPLSPAAGTPYVARKGGTYGDARCFPLPDVERLNNPSIKP